MTNLNEQIRSRMDHLDTQELIEIWVTNDRTEYAEETFDIIKFILKEQGESIPPQNSPVDEDNKSSNSRTSLNGFISFDVMISSSLLKALYWLGAVAIIIIGFALGSGILQKLIVVILGNLFWRLTCEGLIIFFRIHELLVSIDKKLPKNK